MPRKLAAGNWKMNGLADAAGEIDALIADAFGADCDVLICPPATLIADFARRAKGSAVAIGGQNCHPQEKGAHTGDLSAEMLADAGASHVMVGHSERRADHGDDDASVNARARAAWRAGLVAIVCIGETESERDGGQAMEVVGHQLAGSVPDEATPANTVIAYEPVWAIGTGRTPSEGDIAGMHQALRALLCIRFGDEAGAEFRLLYGGSMKPDNARAIMALENVDGGLVGGASLKAADFLQIITAAG